MLLGSMGCRLERLSSGVIGIIAQETSQTSLGSAQERTLTNASCRTRISVVIGKDSDHAPAVHVV